MGKKKSEPDLTLNQIRILQADAEDAVAKILRQLEKDTGLLVDRVDAYTDEVVICLQTGLD
jgi:hypothetical protein